jgi:hypothetical protein
MSAAQSRVKKSKGKSKRAKVWNPPLADGDYPKRGRFGYFGVTD